MEPFRIDAEQLRKLSVFVALYAITLGMIASTFLIAPHPITVNHVVRDVIIFFAAVLLAKYLFYMIVSPWHDVWSAWTKRYWKTRIPTYRPLVSVLIPAWNEEVGILGTITSLLESTYDKLEIIIVNDGSTDNSDQLIREYQKEYQSFSEKERGGKSIVYHYQENGGKGKALNTAIGLSHGEILVSIDADCIVMPEAIGNFVEYFRNPGVMAAVGNVKVGNKKTLIGLVQYMEFLFSFYFKKADSLMNTIYIIGGAAGAFRREVFDKIGMYNTENITEDIDLSIRIQDAGMRIVYAHDAVVYTEAASDMPGLLKQRLRWKRGRFETFHDYIHMFFSVRRRHNKILTLVMLPLAMFSEAQLFFEFWFLAFLYVYSILSADFSSFLSGILVVSSMFMIQVLFDDKKTRNLSFILLAPIGWLLFYATTFVETHALIRSIWGALTKQQITWQHWQRKGVTQ